MSRINPRLIYWIAAVHRQPELKAAHRDVLIYLAVMRLDYGTGKGYCSMQSLAGGRGWHEHTVRRALELAQKVTPPLLRRTRRGHRLGNGQVVASEWQVLYPPMSTGHGGTVENGSTVHNSDLNRPESESQPSTGARPTGSESPSGNESSSSLSLTGLLADAVPGASEREIEYAITTIQTRCAQGEIRDERAYLRTIIAKGDAASLIEKACRELAGFESPGRPPNGDRALAQAEALKAELGNRMEPRQTAACRSDDHDFCPSHLACSCTCHERPASFMSGVMVTGAPA